MFLLKLFGKVDQILPSHALHMHRDGAHTGTRAAIHVELITIITITIAAIAGVIYSVQPLLDATGQSNLLVHAIKCIGACADHAGIVRIVVQRVPLVDTPVLHFALRVQRPP